MNAALFHDAKAGSFTALAQLGVLAHENENIFRRLLPVILGHLNSHPVPKSSFPQAQTEAEIYSLIPSFDAVAGALRGFEGASSTSDSELTTPSMHHLSRTFIQDNWNLLIEWMTFIVIHVLEREIVFHQLKDPDWPRRELCVPIIAFIGRFAQNQAPKNPRSSTQREIDGLLLKPGYMALATRIWLYAIRHKIHKVDMLVPLLSMVNEFLWDARYPHFVDLMNANPDSVSLCLSSIRHYSRSRNAKSSVALLVSLFFLDATIQNSHRQSPGMSSLRDKFLSQHSINVVTKVISQYSKGNLSEPYAKIALKFAGTYLRWCFFEIGSSSIVKSLKGRLLPSIYMAIQKAQQDTGNEPNDVTDILGFLLHSVTIHAVHLPVLRETRKWYRTADWEVVLQQPGLDNDWQDLEKSLTSKFKDRRWHKDLGYSPLNLCNFAECKTFGADEPVLIKEMQCCQGCLRVFYCSRQCQKSDWQLSHHDECCKNIPEIHDSDVIWTESAKIHFAPLNLHFIRCLLMREFCINEFFSTVRASADRGPFVCQFDYTHVSVIVKAFHADEFLLRDDLEPWDEETIQLLQMEHIEKTGRKFVIHGLLPRHQGLKFPLTFWF